ncbi:MAG: hypothetical protein KGK16_13990 [Bradyrhizobium sp.]|nr:hypothetical protein [Bradyrhizobium sp.]
MSTPEPRSDDARLLDTCSAKQRGANVWREVETEIERRSPTGYATVTREWPDPFEIVERGREINAIRERLTRLESEKAELEASLGRLVVA